MSPAAVIAQRAKRQLDAGRDDVLVVPLFESWRTNRRRAEDGKPSAPGFSLQPKRYRFALCSVGCTHGYSHSGPFGAGPSKRHYLNSPPVGRGEGEPLYFLPSSGIGRSKARQPTTCRGLSTVAEFLNQELRETCARPALTSPTA